MLAPDADRRHVLLPKLDPPHRHVVDSDGQIGGAGPDPQLGAGEYPIVDDVDAADARQPRLRQDARTVGRVGVGSARLVGLDRREELHATLVRRPCAGGDRLAQVRVSLGAVGARAEIVDDAPLVEVPVDAGRPNPLEAVDQVVDQLRRECDVDVVVGEVDQRRDDEIVLAHKVLLRP